MSAVRLITPLAFAAIFLVPPPAARAQRGELIEGLFRTITEAQLERERRKRIEAERAAIETHAIERERGELNLPPSLRRPTSPAAPRPNSINVRSREAAAFAQDLVNFNNGIDPLVADLKRAATRNAAIRGFLPEAYQVSADTRSLIRRCDGLSSLQPIVGPYSELDARWRQLSFSLRSLGGLSDQCSSSIRACDKLASSMTRQLRIEPQFDRRELHDLMIVGATYMQSLLDDLQLAAISPQQEQALAHDCRLLRQRLLGEADRVEDTSYEDVVTRFTDFVSRWNGFAERVYAINDPHLNRRLNRISECGDRTYAILWMPPPYNARSLTANAHRLEQGYGELLDQLTFRTLASLNRQDQLAVFETCRGMMQRCRDLEALTTKNASRRDLERLFVSIDRDWASVRGTFASLPTINRGTLAGIDHECEQLRSALGITASADPLADLTQLVQVAAALEGASEYFDADIRRYERYLQPASYKKSIVDASHEVYHHAKRLHAELSGRADLVSCQREAGFLIDGWQQLSKDLTQIESRGLSAGRSDHLKRAHRELVPLVAQVAAALLER